MGGATAATCASAPSLTSIAGGTMCMSRFEALPASPTALDFWVADDAVAGGGYRVMLTAGSSPISAGGHTYQFSSSDGLFGKGTFGGVAQAINGYVEIRVDGQAAQIRFDLTGCGQLGMPPARLAAQIKRTRGSSTETVLRTYEVTTPSSSSVQFNDTERPDSCAVGVDLLGLKL
jgi:hypothetical protein